MLSEAIQKHVHRRCELRPLDQHSDGRTEFGALEHRDDQRPNRSIGFKETLQPLLVPFIDRQATPRAADKGGAGPRRPLDRLLDLPEGLMTDDRKLKIDLSDPFLSEILPALAAAGGRL